MTEAVARALGLFFCLEARVLASSPQEGGARLAARQPFLAGTLDRGDGSSASPPSRLGGQG